MNLPKTLKVGWKIFTIEVWDPVQAAADHKYGECDHLAKIIRVDVTHGTRQAVETLLHECFHAAFDIGGANESKCTEEEFLVNYTASWLMTMIIDNPILLDVLKQAVDADGA